VGFVLRHGNVKGWDDMAVLNPRRRALIAALIAAPALARADAPLRVTASFSILADMARQIAGDRASVRSLVQANGDVHAFEPRPSDLRAVADTRLLIENGLGLEGWMTRLRQAANLAGPMVVASTGITPRQMTEDGAVAIDPHAWQDPHNGEIYAANITDGLVAADPVQAAGYRDAGRAYIEAIRETDRWITRALAGIPPERRKIITTHDAFGYFGDRYGIEFRAAEGLSTDAEPSAKAIAALVGQIRRENIKAVFLENMTNPRIATMLAREAGAILGGTVYSDALSEPGGVADTYLKMFRHNVTLFVAAMRAN
jgi:zinc/manganese transport system substrate-binding protein